MKNHNITLGILLFLTLFFIRCTPNMDHTDPLKETLTRGSWTVDHFFAGSDRTNELQSYNFTFDPSGKLLVANNNTNIEGKWAIVQKVAGPAIELRFDSAEMNQIVDQWDVKTATFTDISLAHNADILVFSKN